MKNRKKFAPQPQVTKYLVRVHQTMELAGCKKDYVQLAVIREYQDKLQVQFIFQRNLRNLEKLHYIVREGDKYKILRPITV
jgi:hypothetical protein